MSAVVRRADRIIGFLAFALVLVFAAAVFVPQMARAADGTPHAIMQLKDGTVDIELLPKLAPKQVERIITLTNQGFYNGLVFHRVIDGFMAQTGDPTGTGMGGSKLPDLPAEFSSEPFVRGVLGAARAQDPNSANSQFFITFADASFLNNQYTVFGKVVSGMEFVDKIKKGDQANNGTVTDPDKIVSMKIEYRK
ncbi:MAG: Peptidyl-prolyl cis-trans isomerase [Hyphomicrobiales bacterium]|jgi:peptidylprolyl isomerase|nr:Peptidyl-prolyl cis-trans isomerase [Hyphomicrobiales bacterium]